LERRLSALDEINDETLKKRLSRLGSPPPDTVIREAGVVLEDRLRTVGGVGSDLHGKDLVEAILSPGRGTLVFSSHPGEQDGVRMLYRGAMQFIRNPPMHKLIEYPESTARLFIRLIDTLLLLLSEGGLQREDAVTAGRKGQRRKWSEEEFFRALSESVEPSAVRIVRDLYEWGESTADRIRFGTGVETGSFTFHYLRDGKTFSVFTIYTNGRLVLNYGVLSDRLDQESLEEFHRRITKLPGFRRVRADFSAWPSVRLADAFRDSDEVEEFKQAVHWLRNRIGSSD
jgi:hypothetical protein